MEMDGGEDVEIVNVQMEADGGDDVEIVNVQMEVDGGEDVDGEEGLEVVYVQVDDQDQVEDMEVEEVEVQLDEALAELEFMEVVDVLHPDVDGEVSKYVLFIQQNQKITIIILIAVWTNS